jgi:phosphoserine phosphatase
MAANVQVVGQRFARLANVAMAAPFLWGGPLRDATVGARVTWMGLRGVSEDRIHILAEEYADRFVIPSLRDRGVSLLRQAQRKGRRVVLISDNLDLIVQRLANHLQVSDWVANRMEFEDGRAIGKLADPVVGGTLAADWVRRFAQEEGLDLASSAAYGGQGDDSLLLNTAGLPCAVYPDRELRQRARDLNWPVVEG